MQNRRGVVELVEIPVTNASVLPSPEDEPISKIVANFSVATILLIAW